MGGFPRVCVLGNCGEGGKDFHKEVTLKLTEFGRSSRMFIGGEC